MTINIHYASSREEKEKVYRFRYKIYHQELQKDCLIVDHENQIICDAADETATIIYVEEEGKIIGTLRTNLGTFGELPLSLQEKFQTQIVEQILGTDKVSISGFMMVEPEYRSGVVGPMMVSEIFDYGFRKGILVNYCLCELPLLKMYQRLGYRQYRSHIYLNASEIRVPLVLCVTDYDYLLKVQSPFALSLTEDANDHGKTAKLLSHIYDEFQSEISSQNCILAKMTLVKFSTGDHVILSEKKSLGIFTVVSGHFWHKNADSAQQKISYTATEYFGDTLGQRGEFIATEPSEVLLLTTSAFNKWQNQYPELAAKLLQNISGSELVLEARN